MKITYRHLSICFLTILSLVANAQEYETIYTQSFETEETCEPLGFPFANSQCFSDWSNTHGTPHLKSVNNAYDGVNHAYMYIVCNSIVCPQNPDKGEGIVLDFDFVAGETYQLSYAIRAEDPEVSVGWYLTNTEFNPPPFDPTAGTCAPLFEIPGVNETQSVLWPGTLLSPEPDWMWIDNLEDFTPSQDYNFLWIRASVCEGTGGEPLWSGVHLDSLVIKRKLSTCEQTEANSDFIWSFNGSSPNIWAYGYVPTNLCSNPQITWDFGDGQSCIQGSTCTMNGPVVTHQYQYCGTYDLCMEVKTECEGDSTCVFSVCKEVTIEEDCEDPCEELESQSYLYWSYNGPSSSIFAYTNVPNDICGTTQINLDFGDGTATCVQGLDCNSPFPNLALHTYAQCGTYNLCMEVISDCYEKDSCVFTICKEVIIDEDCETDPCEINTPEINVDIYAAGKPVWFDLTIEGATCPIDQIEWSFGDGETCIQGLDCVLDGDKIFHEYENCGTYALNVTLTDQCGCSYEYDQFFSICKINNEGNKQKLNNDLTNTPNPFTEQTTIRYQIDLDQTIDLSIVDINGNLLKQLIKNKFQHKGLYSVEYDTKNLVRGTYFCILKGSTGISEVIKIVKIE